MVAGEEVGVMENLSVRRPGVGCIAWLDVSRGTQAKRGATGAEEKASLHPKHGIKALEKARDKRERVAQKNNQSGASSGSPLPNCSPRTVEAESEERAATVAANSGMRGGIANRRTHQFT